MLRGREVRSVRRGSIADEAGLVEGDLLVHVNGRVGVCGISKAPFNGRRHLKPNNSTCGCFTYRM